MDAYPVVQLSWLDICFMISMLLSWNCDVELPFLWFLGFWFQHVLWSLP
jgi:hypothetical protein